MRNTPSPRITIGPGHRATVGSYGGGVLLSEVPLCYVASIASTSPNASLSLSLPLSFPLSLSFSLSFFIFLSLSFCLPLSLSLSPPLSLSLSLYVSLSLSCNRSCNGSQARVPPQLTRQTDKAPFEREKIESMRSKVHNLCDLWSKTRSFPRVPTRKAHPHTPPHKTPPPNAG